MTKIEPDNQAATEFLRLYEPEGPWVLTCISTDRKGIATRTFNKDEDADLQEWLTGYNGERNIYFHVNPTTHAVTSKANREEIAALAWLHVDIDPRAGEDLQEERERCLGLLTDALPKGIPKPTCIVFSGGGYQGFWRLETPIPVDGDLSKAEEAKLYNLQLETVFGGDNCHNIDRIMRLPGTINLPDARKVKKGRVPVLAELHSFSGHVFDISHFKKAADIQSPSDTALTGAKKGVEVGGDVRRVLDLDELDEWNVPNRVKIIIAQGSHPDEPKDGDNSRSSWLFDACCNLARYKVPDEIIYAIITDPEWGIAESVVELKGNSAHKYALRTITRAREHAMDPALEELNSQFMVIETIGGKCRIIEEVTDLILDRPRLTIQSFQDFSNRFSHRKVKVDTNSDGTPKYMPLGKWWLQHEDRSQAHSITFAPGKDVGRAYNLWKGFACEARPGNCELFLHHILTNICKGNVEHYDYTMGWLARMVQQPATPGEVALVLCGGRGTGKSFFAVQLGKLLGRHFLHVSNSSHLTGNFNSHLRDLVLLFGDEAFFAGDKKHASILKTLITEHTLTIERKGVDVENAPNFIHLIMASNDRHVVPAGEMERRFFVLDVGTEHQQDNTYFKAIADQMDDGGREALLYMLQEHDLSGFNVRRVPRTEALQSQQALSLDNEGDWWYQKLDSGDILLEGDGWPELVLFSGLMDDYVEHCKRLNISKRSSSTGLGMLLRKLMPGKVQKVKRVVEVEVDHGRGYVDVRRRPKMHYRLPSLAKCRERWVVVHGPTNWDMDVSEEQGELKPAPF